MTTLELSAGGGLAGAMGILTTQRHSRSARFVYMCTTARRLSSRPVCDEAESRAAKYSGARRRSAATKLASSASNSRRKIPRSPKSNRCAIFEAYVWWGTGSDGGVYATFHVAS